MKQLQGLAYIFPMQSNSSSVAKMLVQRLGACASMPMPLKHGRSAKQVYRAKNVRLFYHIMYHHIQRRLLSYTFGTLRVDPGSPGNKALYVLH